MIKLMCPICGKELIKKKNSLVCEGNHCFDIASEGYVNLLPANQKHSLNPGDDKEMVQARSRFLQKGYYQPLCKKIAELLNDYTPKRCSIVDSGCGEGYYTNEIYETLCAEKEKTDIVGIDISKAAVKHASKHSGGARFAVGSAYHLPIGDCCADALLNCFSPLCESEFSRVLKTDGCFLYVVPAPKHLWELKCAAYDKPYENERKTVAYHGFTLEDAVQVKSNARLESADDIQSLFRMTPYFWKTPKEGKQRVSELEKLDVTVEFDIYRYKKR